MLVLRCISARNAGESDCAVHSATTFWRQVGFVFVAWHLQTRLARLPRMWHLMEQGVEEDLLSDTSLLWTFLGSIKTYTPLKVCWPGDSFYAKPIRNKQTNTLKTQIDARTHAGSHAGTSTHAPDNLSVPQAKRFWARNSSGKLDRQEVLCGGDHLSILDLHLASLCALRHQRGSLSAAVPTCPVSFP